ncbi:hypothetical protein [Streptomyces erythrochromogenes]|uniref:hypothetical protein n=1 Tax=Streptomyces erythrochromogenes TaxID=285574 RepID=UPI003431D7D5
MPRTLKGPFLTLLYALGAAASTDGYMRFRDGKRIRIQDIAAGVGSNEKDCRRYLNAAIAAGVVVVEGERGHGRQALYRIFIHPNPDWSAAVASLAESQPKPRKTPRKPAPWQDQENGSPTPEPEAASSGDRHPNSAGESSGDRHPTEFGPPTPERFGCPTPEHPRVSQVLPQESAAVGDHLTLGGAPDELGEPPEYDDPDPPPAEADPFDVDPPAPAPPQLTLTTQQRRDARAAEVKTKSAASRGQMPLLLSVREPEHVATVADVRAAAETDPEAVRRAIRTLGRTEAIKVYGWRLVSPHLRNDNPDTDTA